MKNYLLLISFLFSFTSLRADFISLVRADQCETITEIFIEESRIKVTLEIGLKDLPYFMELIPNELLPSDMQNLDRKKMLNAFFEERFVIKADGKTLKGRLNKVELMPRIYRASLYTGVVDTNSRVTPEVLFVEIEYGLINKPSQLTIIPPIEEGNKSTRANIGFVTYHKGIPVHDLRYLGMSETLFLDWKDPWYSNYDNVNLIRHHQSSLLSFLYIDPYEVRHEVLVRVKDLDYWIELGHGIDDKINLDEQEVIKDKVAQFLKGRNIVTIDGVNEEPILDRVHWVKWSLGGMQIIEGVEEMDYSTAIIGVIFVYPNDSIPQEVTVDWDMWNERIVSVPTVATDPAGPLPYILLPDDNVLKWTNYLKKYKMPTIVEASIVAQEFKLAHIFAFIFFLLVILFIVFVKKRMIAIVAIAFTFIFLSLSFVYEYSVPISFIKKKHFNEPESAELITHLLKNTYRAFDFRDESAIYDKLAISNDGELLNEVYIQTKKGMALENQGGLEVKVKNVLLENIEEVDNDGEGLSYKANWIVSGDVGHWGHIHQRINQYTAILKIHAVDGVWKFYDIELLEEVRL